MPAGCRQPAGRLPAGSLPRPGGSLPGQFARTCWQPAASLLRSAGRRPGVACLPPAGTHGACFPRGGVKSWPPGPTLQGPPGLTVEQRPVPACLTARNGYRRCCFWLELIIQTRNLRNQNFISKNLLNYTRHTVRLTELFFLKQCRIIK